MIAEPVRLDVLATWLIFLGGCDDSSADALAAALLEWFNVTPRHAGDEA